MAAVTALSASGLAWACLSPTQITLQLTTDVTCDRLKGTSIYGGSGDRAASEPMTSTARCIAATNHSDIGTLVVTPGASGDRAAFTAVVGVDRPSESCAAAGYQGCIVARRLLSFITHERLTLPIDLSGACIGVPCDESHTCVSSQCVSAEVDPNDPCKGGLCTVSTTDGGVVAPADGGVPLPADGSVPEAGAGAALAIRTGVQVYGLAASASTLYFVQRADPGPPIVVEAAFGVSPDAARTQIAAVPRSATGIAYLETLAPTLGIAGTIDPGAGSVPTSIGESFDLGSPTPQLFAATGQGFGIIALASPFWLVTMPPSVVTVTSSSDLTSYPTTSIFTGYVDRFGSDLVAYAGVLGGVVSISLNAAVTDIAGGAAGTRPFGSLPQANDFVLGVAVSRTYVYVSAANGALFAMARSGGAVQPLGVTINGAQDLLYRPPTSSIGARGELYIAGADGIYRMPALD